MKRKVKGLVSRSPRAEVLRLRAELAEAEAKLARSKQREAEQEEDPDAVLPQDDEPDGAVTLAADDDEGDGERGTDDGLEGDGDADSAETEAEKAKRSARGTPGSSLVKRERSRIAEIRGICSSFGINADQEEKYIRNGTGVDAVRKDVLASLQSQRFGPGVRQGGTGSPSPLIADAERRAGKGATR